MRQNARDAAQHQFKEIKKDIVVAKAAAEPSRLAPLGSFVERVVRIESLSLVSIASTAGNEFAWLFIRLSRHTGTMFQYSRKADVLLRPVSWSKYWSHCVRDQLFHLANASIWLCIHWRCGDSVRLVFSEQEKILS